MWTRESVFPRILDWLLVLFSGLVLMACLFFTYATTYLAQYPGFGITPDLRVLALEPCEAETALCRANRDALQVGDRLIRVGDLSAEEFLGDRRRILFGGYSPGDAVPITFLRGGEEQTVNWRLPGPTAAGRAYRLSISLLLCIPYWLTGTVTLLLVRPRDLRWCLFITLNYLTAIWLAVGIHSTLRVAYVCLMQHSLAWLLVPVYLHFHLIVPSPLLRHHQRHFLPPLYATAAILAVLELLQALPGAVFNLGLLMAFLGSIGPMAVRLFIKSHAPDRVTIRLMLVGIGLSGFPATVLWAVPALSGIPLLTGLSFLYVAACALPLLPLFYLYAIFKRRLGSLEFRANRLLGVYGFLLLYVTAFIVVFLIASHWLGPSGGSLVFHVVILIVFVVAAMPLHRWFQRQIDRLAYGAKYDPDHIVHVFASRIPGTLNIETLAHVLADDVAPSLLIRQSALFLLREEKATPVYASDVGPLEMPETFQQVHQLLARAGRYRPSSVKAHDRFDWVRLAIPIEARERTSGVWLFGRRDPDDYYPQRDVALLTTLARQVAVTVENARLYERAQREIVERKRAEETLLESEERLRAVVQNMPVMLDALDADNRIIVWNQECERVTGYSAEEIVGNPRALELLYPDAGYLQRVLAKWGERGDSRDWELQLTSKDGSIKTVAWSDMSKRFPIPGWATWAIGVNITKRKRMEEALQESEKIARAILNATRESVILVDDQGTILSLNQTAASRLGRSTDELVGLRIEDFSPELLPPALAESRAAQIHEVIRSGRLAHFEDERAGMVFDSTIYPIFAEGKVKRLAIFAQDITARRKAKQQVIRAERLAAMGYLATALAHEINNPLQTIRGYLELLLTFSLEPGEQREHLGITLEEIERLIGITQRMLDFARPAKDTHHSIPVAHLVQKALSLMDKHLQLAHIHATVNLPEDLPLVFVAPDQITQVLLNLITNAIQAVPDGGHLRITAHADGNMVMLALTNDGPHLTSEQIEHLFDPFFTTKPGGTGMGLSISHNIISQHGGAISMENLEGEKGVTFTITLPTASLSEQR
jgi:two-component system, sporulation sensor kinase E